MSGTHENLKTIWFEDELLPKWAQLLDAAARLCPVSQETKSWFSRLTNSSGVDDARTIVSEARILRRALRENKDALITQLQRTRGDGQAARIVAAWEYSLDTMIQGAASSRTCSWRIEGGVDSGEGDYGDADITLRRL